MRFPKKTVEVSVDPLSFISELEILSGDIVQCYNSDNEEYEPDRAITPLLLMPFVSVYDMNGIMKGKATITGAEWFLGLPETGTLISNNDEFTISASGTPTYSLKVFKNIAPGEPLQLTCRFTFTDSRTNTSEIVERSISLYSTRYESQNYSLTLNQPGLLIIDPTRWPVNASGERIVNLSAQLLSGKEPVPDDNAVYWWYMKDGNNYRLIDPEEDLFFLADKTVSGHYPKNVSIDARFLAETHLRVRAAFYEGIPPSAPKLESLQGTTTIKTQLPKVLGEIVFHKGATILPGINQAIEAECIIYDNKVRIENPELYYDIIWYAKTTKTGSTAKVIGYGNALKTTSNELGVTNTMNVEIWAEANEKGAYGLLTDGGVVLTDNGVILITQ